MIAGTVALKSCVAGAQRDDQLDAVVLDVVDARAGGSPGADDDVLGADAEGDRAGVAREPGAAGVGERELEAVGHGEPAVVELGRAAGSSPASRRSRRRRCRAGAS